MSEKADNVFRVGLRPSLLAVTQGELVVEQLVRHHPDLRFELVKIVTTGDRKQGQKRTHGDDKRDWILEIEEALLSDKIDFAVHSGKDVPVDCHSDTTVFSLGARANPRDVFIGKGAAFKDLAPGSTIGTSSIRRQAQLLRLRPDVNLVALRGNVPTRIDALKRREDLSGIVLASAGLQRLGLEAEITEEFSIAEMVPAVSQGILAAQVLTGRQDVVGVLNSLSEAETKAAWDAERAFIRTIGADCNSCVGVHAEVKAGQMKIQAIALCAKGSDVISEINSGPMNQATQLGDALGKIFLDRGVARLLDARVL